MSGKNKRVLIVANWKEHFNISKASIFLHKLQESVIKHRDTEVVLAPNFLALHPLQKQLDHSKFKLAAQDAYYEDVGPYTGEVSASMLRGLVDYVIIGHSMRRELFGDTDKIVGFKAAAVVRNNMTAIVCVGENATERAAGETDHILTDQLNAALASVTASDMKKIVIAYEPVWAISTTKGVRKPLPDEIFKAIKKIKDIVEHRYGKRTAGRLRVLYGGSVDGGTAQDYLSISGVGGLLVGSASLRHKDFAEIVERAHSFKD